MNEGSGIEQRELNPEVGPPKGCKEIPPNIFTEFGRWSLFSKDKIGQLPDNAKDEELRERSIQIRSVFEETVSRLVEDPYGNYGTDVGLATSGFNQDLNLSFRDLLFRGLRRYQSGDFLIITDPRIKISGLEVIRVAVGGVLKFRVERKLPNGIRRVAGGECVGIALNTNHRLAEPKKTTNTRSVLSSPNHDPIDIGLALINAQVAKTYSEHGKRPFSIGRAIIAALKARMSLAIGKKPSETGAQAAEKFFKSGESPLFLTQEEFVKATDWVLGGNK